MTVKKRPGEIVQVNLRMREDFRQRLLREAEKGERSFNQELVRRLEESFRRDAADAALGRAEAALVEANANFKSWEVRMAAFESRVAENVADGARIMKRLLAEKLMKAENENETAGEHHEAR
jgi:hypothetical protein